MLTRDRFDLIGSPARSTAIDLFELSESGPTPESWSEWEAEIENLNRTLIDTLTAAGWTLEQIERALLDLITYGLPQYWAL